MRHLGNFKGFRNPVRNEIEDQIYIYYKSQYHSDNK